MSAVTVSHELALWRDIAALKGTIERALEQRLQRDAGISVADFDILSALVDAIGGRLRARDLAETVAWEKSRLSHQVTRMETRGLVVREDCPSDLRGTWIVLTEAGHDAAARSLPGHADVLGEHFSVLDDEARSALDDAIRRVKVSSAAVCESQGSDSCTG